MIKKELSALFRELIDLENVVGVGRGYKCRRGESTKSEAAVVLVKKKFGKEDLRRNDIIPSRMNGVMTDVVEVGDIRLLSERLGFQRPARPGISIGHYKVSAGTFGAVVRDRISGELLILSNNHVLANLSNGLDDRAKIGDLILQPGSYDGGNVESSGIGHLKRFIPLYSEVAVPQCRIAKLFEDIVNKCFHILKPNYQIQVLRENEKINMMDCAVASPLTPEVLDSAILDIGEVMGMKNSKVGITVKKSGRSSGVTFGSILATDVTIKIGVTKTECGIFADQVLTGAMSMPGDSGSLVLTEDNYAVGLLFAGSDQATMFSPIQRVCDALEITI